MEGYEQTPELRQNHLDYLSQTVKALNGGIDALEFAMQLAKDYTAIKVYRSERGDLMFAGRCPYFGSVERFYLHRFGWAGDEPPYETLWGTVNFRV